jgi:hypothetical protein
LMKLQVVHKPATEEREGINPFTKEPTILKAKPASKLSGIGFVPATDDRVIPAIEREGSCGFSSAETLKGTPWQENSQWQSNPRSKHFTNRAIRTAK